MSDGATEHRRGFLSVVTAALASLIGALALFPGLKFLAHPLRASTVSGGEGLIRVAAPGDLKAGRPIRVTVTGQRRDGWTRLDRVKLGAAWLVRTAEGRVRAFSTVCPHLGCGIEWRPGAENFQCPCHDSSFDLDGRRLHGPAPRGLDELEVAASDSEIRIRYQRFRLSIREKEPTG